MLFPYYFLIIMAKISIQNAINIAITAQIPTIKITLKQIPRRFIVID